MNPQLPGASAPFVPAASSPLSDNDSKSTGSRLTPLETAVPVATAPVMVRPQPPVGHRESADLDAQATERQIRRDMSSDRLEDFIRACRLLPSLENPGPELLDLVGKTGPWKSLLADRAARFSLASSGALQQIQQQLTELAGWIQHQPHGQARWHYMLKDLLHYLEQACDRWRLSALGLASLAGITMDASREKEETALIEAMMCWLLEKDWMRPSVEGGYYFGDHLLCAKLEKLASDWNSQAGRQAAQRQVHAWFQAWFGMDSDPDNRSERRPLPAAGSLAFHDWNPSCYAGRLPTLEAVLSAGMPPIQGDERLARLVNQGAAHPDTAGPGRQLLVLGAPPWRQTQLASVAAEQARAISPDSDAQPAIQKACSRVLQWSFCACLQTLASGHTAELRAQQIAKSRWTTGLTTTSGLRTMTSAEELTRSLLLAPQYMYLQPMSVRNIEPARAACGDPAAIVLDEKQLAGLVDEFLATLDKQAFVEAVGSQLETLVEPVDSDDD